MDPEESPLAGRSTPRDDERVSITTGTITDSYVVLDRRVLIPTEDADAPDG